MENKNCLYCGDELPDVHGNTEYCLDTDCAKLAKLERQNGIYRIGDPAKKAIQKNYKLMTELLSDDEKLILDLLTVLKKGFDPNGYYGSTITNDKSEIIYHVEEFRFCIPSYNQQTILIWKILKD